MKLKLVSVERSTGLLLSAELERPGVETGDSISVVEAPDGYLIRALDRDVEEQMSLVREGMEQFRET